MWQKIYAIYFRENGIVILSAVLKSDVVVKVSIKIMNNFMEMRRFFLSDKEMLLVLIDLS